MQVIHAFVRSLLALDPDASVLVIGDLNDFPFSATLTALSGDALTNLVTTLPAAEQYNYVFDGNSQELGHLLVSPHLRESANVEFDIVHVNAEFAEATRPTDHDPFLARIRFDAKENPVRRIYLPIISRN